AGAEGEGRRGRTLAVAGRAAPADTPARKARQDGRRPGRSAAGAGRLRPRALPAIPRGSGRTPRPEITRRAHLFADPRARRGARSAALRAAAKRRDEIGSRVRTGPLLIDSTHRRWLLVVAGLGLVALLLHLWLERRSPAGVPGGHLPGLFFGLVGFALMLYAAALSLLRRVPSWWWIGARKTWLRGHVWLGALSGVLILCHSGFHLGGPFEQVLMILLLLTLGTGVVGLVL